MLYSIVPHKWGRDKGEPVPFKHSRGVIRQVRLPAMTLSSLSFRPLLALMAVFVLSLAPSCAQALQTAKPDPQAERIADQSVREWLVGKFKVANAAAPRTADEATARTLEENFLVNQSPKGANVNFALRKVQESAPGRVSFSYPLSSDDIGDANLIVTVVKTGSEWAVRSIRIAPDVSLIPSEVYSTLGGWVFVLLTALLAYGVLAQTLWRRWMVESWAVNRAFFSVILWTNIVLYGLFVLGSLFGAAFPLTVNVIRELVSGALSQGGLEGLRDASVPSAAFAITVNNLRAGILISSFVPGSLFAVPAYLLSFSTFIFYGVALSPIGLPPVVFALHVPTIIIEMQAYIYVVASSGVMLARLTRSRIPFGLAWRDYAKGLTVAITILVVAAWYEAFEIMVLIPLFSR